MTTTTTELTNDQAERFGRELIALLGLRVKANGRVDTRDGDKTPLGLGHTVHRAQQEALAAQDAAGAA